RSCAACKREKLVLVKGKVKALYKDILHDEDGTEYYSPRYAARVLGVDKSTFREGQGDGGKIRPGWKASCPFNDDGKGLPTKPMKSLLGRKVHYFHGPTVEKVKRHIQNFPQVPTFPDLVYIDDAAKYFPNVRKMRQKMADNGVQMEYRLGKDANGKPA